MVHTASNSRKVLEGISDSWGLPLNPAGCIRCGQTFLLPQFEGAVLCPVCAEGELQNQPVLVGKEIPECVIDIGINLDQISTGLKAFCKEVLLPLSDFTAEKLISRMKLVFWPLWLLDITVDGSWNAEHGFDYEVKSTREQYSGGSWQSKDVIEGKTKWEPRTGLIKHTFLNTCIPALTNYILIWSRTGGYNLDHPTAFSSDIIRDAILWLPNVTPKSAWEEARKAVDELAATQCQVASSASSSRNFISNFTYSREKWTLLLMPLYMTWYKDDKNDHHSIVINGQSGVINGRRIASVKRGLVISAIVGLIAAVLFLLGFLIDVVGGAFPPMLAFGTILLIVGILLGISAVVPAIWPLHWNRRQEDIDKTIYN